MQFRRCRGVAVLAMLELLTCAGLAQQTPASPLRVFAESIPGSVPPAFAADSLIRLADSAAAQKETPGWREDLYQRAFELAAGAQDPLPQSRAPGVLIDARASALENAGRFGLDALSLRARTIKALLEFRQDRALALAALLDVRIPPATCRDTLVANPTALFDIARLLPYDALERQILSVHSSTEIAPALEAIQASTLSAEHERSLLVALTGILKSIDDDDLSFSASAEQTWTSVKRALENQGDEAVTVALLDGFRAYLVLHLTGTRCAPPGVAPDAFVTANQPTLADINDTLERYGRPRLTIRERTPSRIVEMPPAPRSFRSKIAQQLAGQIKELQYGGQRLRSVEEREQLDLAEQVSRIRATIAAWRRGDETSTADYFHERRIMLGMLIDAIPPGSGRDAALGDLIALLKAEGHARASDVEWFVSVRLLIDHYKNSDQRDWILKALAESGDPVMRLYAQLEELIG